MQRESQEPSQDAVGERYFNHRAFLSHYAHIQANIRRSQKCGFCTQGLGAVVAIDTPKPPENGVDEDPGSDEERPATHTSGGRWIWEDDES